MSTTPRTTPARAAGKQKTPAQTASAAVNNASTGLSTFEHAIRAAQESLLGFSDRELVDIGELEREAQQCERSTRDAIREVHPIEKHSTFHSGFVQWQEKLCASAAAYYNDCFELDLKHRDELNDIFSSIAAKSGRQTKIQSPAEFARSFTEGDFSTFLRVTAIDGKQKAGEIDSNGRVREFVWYVCGHVSDVYPFLYAERNAAFRLPQWFSHEWNRKAVLGKLARPPRTPAIDESITLSSEETTKFILDAEEHIIIKMRQAIAHAHRKALIILGKIGTATEAPSKIDPAYIDRRGIPAYQSEVKIAVSRRLSSDNDASDRELCNWLDEKGEAELPSSWAKRGNRSFADAYADNTVKVKMESRFSEVRRDMRKAGYRIP